METSERRRKKEKEKKNPANVKEEEKKKRIANRDQYWKKKEKWRRKGEKWSKVAAVGPSYLFIYENVIELWVMETKNSQNVFSVSITYNSKIRELSDGNRVIETELSCSQIDNELWISPFLTYKLWKQRIELWKQVIQTASKFLF